MRRERGSASLEFVLLAPTVGLLIALAICGGRCWLTQSSVQTLADAAARQASIARTAAMAETAASRLVAQDAAAAELPCEGGPTLDLALEGFAVEPGLPATVTASVVCEVDLADLLIPGIPGRFVAQGNAVSTLDTHRSRG